MPPRRAPQQAHGQWGLGQHSVAHVSVEGVNDPWDVERDPLLADVSGRPSLEGVVLGGAVVANEQRDDVSVFGVEVLGEVVVQLV